MRKGLVYFNKELAGELLETEKGEYVFRYADSYFYNPEKKAVSLTLPKSQKEYISPVLFPFFFNMLAEGANRQLQCRQLKIDDKDHFGLLLATAAEDTIGAVTIKSDPK